MEGNDFIFSVMMLPPHRNAIKIEFVNTKKIQKINVSNNYRANSIEVSIGTNLWNTKYFLK